MKKLSLIFISLFLILQSVSLAQLQIGYVNSDALIKALPDAQDAQKKLDAIIQEWNEEIKKMEKELGDKNTDFEKRKLVMSDNKRIVIEKEITKMKDDIATYRQSKFGYKGELYTQQEEIMKPIQNKIFNAIEDVAEDEELDYVFDKSGDISFLYAKEEYDITAKVLEKLE